MNGYVFVQIYDFSSFLTDFNYMKLFLAKVNRCIITIMIIINVKSFLERHFCRILINSFRK